jgi:hypothetical protein
MTRHAALFAALGFLLISRCATTTAHTSSGVSLTITSDPVDTDIVNELRDTTLKAIEKQVPNAHPMTINVRLHFTSTMPLDYPYRTSEQFLTSYRVVYTISDAAGQVVESNQLTRDNGHLVETKTGTRLKVGYGLFDETAMFLASRVKTLEQ